MSNYRGKISSYLDTLRNEQHTRSGIARTSTPEPVSLHIAAHAEPRCTARNVGGSTRQALPASGYFSPSWKSGLRDS